MRLPCLLLLALAPALHAGTIPVALHNGLLTTTVAGAQVQLGSPFWIWEGYGSRLDVTDRAGELTILFHLDVANGPYWIDLQIIQSDAGVVLVGSHSSGVWSDVCSAYASWDDLLRHRRDDALAEIAVDCLARCGLNDRWELNRN